MRSKFVTWRTRRMRSSRTKSSSHQEWLHNRSPSSEAKLNVISWASFQSGVLIWSIPCCQCAASRTRWRPGSRPRCSWGRGCARPDGGVGPTPDDSWHWNSNDKMGTESLQSDRHNRSLWWDPQSERHFRLNMRTIIVMHFHHVVKFLMPRKGSTGKKLWPSLHAKSRVGFVDNYRISSQKLRLEQRRNRKLHNA